MVLNIRRRRDKKQIGRYRCFLNGHDVSDRAFFADGRRGVVRMFSLDADGNKYRVHRWGEPATEEVRGRVQLVRKRS